MNLDDIVSEDKDTTVVRTALSPVEYWEWRTTIAELEVSKQALARAELEYKLLQKEIDNFVSYQKIFFYTKFSQAKTKFQEMQSEYDKFKLGLEKNLGQSLNNKIIDDISFEIKELPAEPDKK
ncbi:MAG TPA: hypothetical protein VFF49_04820 [Thermodesulfobacteriota bacterium]|nr:hypothetical protein [Thermodesulfobacteriota bacterium]